MKKFFVVLGITVLFLAAGLSYAQDCGKCPSKAKCGAAKIAKVKEADPVVYTKKGDQAYHQKDCKLAKEGYGEIKLSEALKASLKPCTECKPQLPPPPAPPTPPTKPEKEETKENK